MTVYSIFKLDFKKELIAEFLGYWGLGFFWYPGNFILQENDHLTLQASLKGELEASQQQVEAYKARNFTFLLVQVFSFK